MFRLLFLVALSLGLSSQVIAAVKWNNPSSGGNTELGEAVGKKNKPFKLPKDIGFGLFYEQSLDNNFQKWGATTTNEQVRLGAKAIRFETRQGFCGFGSGHSDCDTGRNRHEFSSKVKQNERPFELNKEYWHALSLYVPSEPDFGNSRVQTGLFQFHGQPVAWKFHYSDKRGFFVTSYVRRNQYSMEHEQTFLRPDQFLDKWNDIIIQVIHSTKPDGLLNIWIGGELVYNYSGKTTLPDGKPFFKFGIYNTAKPLLKSPEFNDGATFNDLWVYFDEIRFSETCEGLKLNDLGYNCNKL